MVQCAGTCILSEQWVWYFYLKIESLSEYCCLMFLFQITRPNVFFFCCKYLSLCRKMHPYQNNTASPALLHVSIDMQELVGRSDKRIANPRWLPNIKHLKCCYISQHCYSENGFLKRFLHLNEALKKVSLFFRKIVNYHHYLHCQKTHGPLSTFFLPNDVVVYQGGAII